jgi:hypothetical protein
VDWWACYLTRHSHSGALGLIMISAMESRWNRLGSHNEMHLLGHTNDEFHDDIGDTDRCVALSNVVLLQCALLSLVRELGAGSASVDVNHRQAGPAQSHLLQALPLACLPSSQPLGFFMPDYISTRLTLEGHRVSSP